MPVDVKLPESLLKYYHRIGAEILNFKRAMVRLYKGSYYHERCLIKINADFSISVSQPEYAPTDAEAEQIASDLQRCDFPRLINTHPNNLELLIPKLQGEYYVFLDQTSGDVIMVQETIRDDNGLKNHYPWTFASTGEWMRMEPEGALPFWKPEKREPGAKVMIHEGAKAAAHVQSIDKSHPWYDDLKDYQHWGMIGGALAPHRTNYKELHDLQPKEVVYVCDRDHVGEAALPKVSKCWGKSLKGVVFGSNFPKSFDLGDPMPEDMFREGRWLGPRFKELIVPATWATETVPNPSGKGRPVMQIKNEFAEEWLHAVVPEVYMHAEWPSNMLGKDEFNNAVGPFSDADDTARLLKKAFESKATKIKYDPSIEPGTYPDQGGFFINTYEGPIIEPADGDPGMWFEFMEMLVPDEEDRENLYKWCATLIARPDIRILYGVLLISEVQGIGKSTLGEKILAPLVGMHNTSFPSEQEIVDSQYNYWLSQKRLAVVHEIYAGHSSKAYNKLKTLITDKNITVQKKYQANYQIENWLHVCACSNSMRALKLSADDRRWFVPRLTEEKKDAEYWDRLNMWLAAEGGLETIYQWAIDYVKDIGFVTPGSAAPWSSLKHQLIEESFSPGQTVVANALTEIKERIEEGTLPSNTFVLDTDLIELIKYMVYNGHHSDKLERPLTVRNVAKTMGWTSGTERAKVRKWGPRSTNAKVISLDPAVAAKTPKELAELGRVPYDVVEERPR